MKLPKKYLKTNPEVMKKEIMKHKDKADNDPSAYKEWDADYKSKKAGKGKPVETKPSKYTKKYKEMFGESDEMNSEPSLSERVKARRIMEKTGAATKGDGKDVDHITPLRGGGTSAKGNLRMRSVKANRGDNK